MFLEARQTSICWFLRILIVQKNNRNMERRFDKPWGGDNMTMLFGKYIYLRSTELVRRPSDILGLFQYAKRNRAEFTGRGVMLINNEVIEHIYDENSVENEIIEALRDNRLRYFTSLFITLKRINSPLRGACQNKVARGKYHTSGQVYCCS